MMQQQPKITPNSNNYPHIIDMTDMEFPPNGTHQNILSFANQGEMSVGNVSNNPTNSGISTPLSTLVAAAGKSNIKKRNGTMLKRFASVKEVKQEPGLNLQHNMHNFQKEPNPMPKPQLIQLIQQSGGQFDPKSIDFSALQLPNTPPKTSRHKKSFTKSTSSIVMTCGTSTISMNSSPH